MTPMSRSRRRQGVKNGKVNRARLKSAGDSPSSPLDDGGARSLAGYVYQMVGSASERVTLVDAPTETEVETSARFFVEQHGQDALSTDVTGVRLIQFKYSQDARPIKPSELAEILLTLEKSGKEVRRKWAVHWRLITNRPLSATAASPYCTRPCSPRGDAGWPVGLFEGPTAVRSVAALDQDG